MCTAICYSSDSFYFGRTLDMSVCMEVKTVITQERFSFGSYEALTGKTHRAFIGTALVRKNFPLYFDGINSSGLCAAALNFPVNACYFKKMESRLNLPSFLLIPYILSRFDTAAEAKTALSQLNITDEPFSDELRPSPLHFIIADKDNCLVIEQTKHGTEIYDNPSGVLTNNPPFRYHLSNLAQYSGLSAENKKGGAIPETAEDMSFGMGGVGLPGDFSSSSRFIRAAFLKAVTPPCENEQDSVNRFFAITDSISVPYGAVRNSDGEFHRTIYTSCCNTKNGRYYYTTHRCRTVRCIDMSAQPTDGSGLIVFERE